MEKDDSQPFYKFVDKSKKNCPHEIYMPEHLLLSMIKMDEVTAILGTILEVDISSAKSDIISFINTNCKRKAEREVPSIESLAISRIVVETIKLAETNDSVVTPYHVLLAILTEEKSHACYFLKKYGVGKDNIEEIFSKSEEELVMAIVQKMDENSHRPNKKSGSRSKQKGVIPRDLKDIVINLNQLAADGKIDNVIGREKEINSILTAISKRRKGNAILVGEPGVGKTAIVEGLAVRINKKDVPSKIRNMKIFSVNIPSAISGTQFRGDFEEKMCSLIEFAENNTDIIFFFDEFHLICGSGASSGSPIDAANILKTAMANGKIKIIGATTWDDFKKNIEGDKALCRRIEKVEISEPSTEDTLKILSGLKIGIEKHHDVKISSEAVRFSVELTNKYIRDKAQPDKSLDVLDSVGAHLRMNSKAKGVIKVKTSDIEATVSRIARVPVSTIKVSEVDSVANIDGELLKSIYGQDSAVQIVANSIKAAKVGLRDHEKPIASMLFVGPTGVGKTETCKILANSLGVPLIRFDMSEYQEEISITKLVGSSPGYVGYDDGGQLTEQVFRSPHCVLLLDEIEKAHRNVHNLLLQIMDYGTISDSRGKKVDFRNVVLIMTSNSGAVEMNKSVIGFENKTNSDSCDKAVEKQFPPEFRNRLDCIVRFVQLPDSVIDKIVKKFIDINSSNLVNKNITIQVADDVIRKIGLENFDKKMGARPINRAVKELIFKPLVSEILSGKLKNGGKVSFSLKGSEIVWEVIKH